MLFTLGLGRMEREVDSVHAALTREFVEAAGEASLALKLVDEVQGAAASNHGKVHSGILH